MATATAAAAAAQPQNNASSSSSPAPLLLPRCSLIEASEIRAAAQQRRLEQALARQLALERELDAVGSELSREREASGAAKG